MSNIYTNELDAASGQSILIPSGYNLSLGGTILNSSSIPPDPEDEGGKYLVSNNTDAVFRHIGPTSISTFFNSGTWSRPDGINRVIVRVVGAVAVDQDTLNQQELVGMLKRSLTFEVYLVYTVQ